MGSTHVPHRAGKNPTARAPSVNRNATPINVSGSNGGTSRRSVDKERVENRAAGTPAASPKKPQLRRLRKHKAAKARRRRSQRHAHASSRAECHASVTDRVFNLVLTAIGGCQVRSGLPQSMPLSSIDY